MSKSEKMFSGISEIDADIIEEVQEKITNKTKKPKWVIPVIASAAAVCVCGAAVGSFVYNSNKTPQVSESQQNTAAAAPVTESVDPAPSTKLLARPVYPALPEYVEETKSSDPTEQKKHRELYEEHWTAIKQLRDQPEGYADGTEKFFTGSISSILSGSGSKNMVYSPLSLFMALGMSAEVSDGNTRQQILDLLGQDSIDDLRSHAKSIWQSCYIDDGMATCILAASMWLSDYTDYNSAAMDSLAENYYSSAYSGIPGTEEYDRLFQGWLSEQTDGLLDNYISQYKLSEGMIATIASTVNYAGKWLNKFDTARTEEAVFHSPDGDIKCDFLNGSLYYQTPYFWGEKFAATSLYLENNGAMRLILPDEGITPEELLSDEETLGFMIHREYYDKENGIYVQYPNRKLVEGKLSVPKFDVSSDIGVKDELIKLGITDMFSSETADFSNLTADGETGIYINEIKHAARVTIDEEGCRASALTVATYYGAAMPEDTADLIFDRPFIFEIVSSSGLPLFVGIVNDPLN